MGRETAGRIAACDSQERGRLGQVGGHKVGVPPAGALSEKLNTETASVESEQRARSEGDPRAQRTGVAQSPAGPPGERAAQWAQDPRALTSAGVRPDEQGVAQAAPGRAVLTLVTQAVGMLMTHCLLLG